MCGVSSQRQTAPTQKPLFFFKKKATDLMNLCCRNFPKEKKKKITIVLLRIQRIIAARRRRTGAVRVLYGSVESAVLVLVAGSETDCRVRVNETDCDYCSLITGFVKAHIKIYYPSSRATLLWCRVGASLWRCHCFQ